MKELKETIALMTSADYKERFAAEYYQLETRYLKLHNMCEKWDNKVLEFTPTCSRLTYERQLLAMERYLMVLIERAKVEDVVIAIDSEIEKLIPNMFK